MVDRRSLVILIKRGRQARRSDHIRGAKDSS